MIWVFICWFGYSLAMLLVWKWMHCRDHDMFWDTIATFVRKSGAHEQRKVSHLFPCHTWKWVDIVITKDDFKTMVDIVIVASICINLVECALMTIMYATIFVVQNKKWYYIKQVLKDDFIPLAIKTYDCLHPHFDSYFISCVHISIIYYQQTFLVPSMPIPYYRQRVLIALPPSLTNLW